MRCLEKPEEINSDGFLRSREYRGSFCASPPRRSQNPPCLSCDQARRMGRGLTERRFHEGGHNMIPSGVQQLGHFPLQLNDNGSINPGGTYLGMNTRSRWWQPIQ